MNLKLLSNIKKSSSYFTVNFFAVCRNFLWKLHNFEWFLFFLVCSGTRRPALVCPGGLRIRSMWLVHFHFFYSTIGSIMESICIYFQKYFTIWDDKFWHIDSSLLTLNALIWQAKWHLRYKGWIGYFTKPLLDIYISFSTPLSSKDRAIFNKYTKFCTFKDICIIQYIRK